MLPSIATAMRIIDLLPIRNVSILVMIKSLLVT
jgi:hypothetical protein